MTRDYKAGSIRREEIAEAALKVVSEQGVEALSMAAVARRVGLVPSGVYRHFRDKEDLLDAVLGLIRERLLRNVDTACSETSDPLECLRRILLRHVELIRKDVGIPRVVFSEELYGRRAGRKAEVYQVVRGYLDRIAARVREGQASGRIRPELDPEAVAVLFLGLVQPSAILWHLSDGAFDVTKETERTWAIFRSAIERPDDSTRPCPEGSGPDERRAP